MNERQPDITPADIEGSQPRTDAPRRADGSADLDAAEARIAASLAHRGELDPGDLDTLTHEQELEHLKRTDPTAADESRQSKRTSGRKVIKRGGVALAAAVAAALGVHAMDRGLGQQDKKSAAAAQQFHREHSAWTPDGKQPK